MSNIDVTNRQQYPGYDVPTLVAPTADASVKGITFALKDLNVNAAMSKIPLFTAADLEALDATDGVVELVWRLSDFGMDSKVRGTNLATNPQSLSASGGAQYEGSHGVGGWAGLFQFSLKDISPSFDVSSNRINIGETNDIKGRCNQTHKTPTNNTSIQNNGRVLLDASTTDQMSSCGFWPTELNIMRGIVTDQDLSGGAPFNNMPLLAGVSGQTYSAAEHYMNYVAKELTGSAGGAGLFSNLSNMLSHLVQETDNSGASTGNSSGIAGVQFKTWLAIHTILVSSDQQYNTTGDNIATKLVKALLDDDGGVAGGATLSTDDRRRLRNRFFADLSDNSANGVFKRFGPSGGNCAGVLDGASFDTADYDTWVDVPIAHSDVIEFNLTLKGATNTGPDAVPASEDGAAGNPISGLGADRFGSFLPGNNDIRDVTYRVKIHLEGADTRPL